MADAGCSRQSPISTKAYNWPPPERLTPNSRSAVRPEDAEAQYLPGVLHLNGNGVKREFAVARKLIESAAS